MLTKQENKIINLVCGCCYSDKEAANILNISTRTVVNHKQNIFQKLGLNKSTELSAWYWCKKFNTEFNLEAIKKQFTAIALFICMIPTLNDFDMNMRRNNRVVNNRATTSRIITPIRK